jgi:hypothetical protein
MKLRFWNRLRPSNRDDALRALEDLKHNRLLRPSRYEKLDKRELSLTELITLSGG